MRSSRTPAPRTSTRRRRADEVLVAVDVGNSETTVGRFRGEVLDGFWRLTSMRLTADEIALQLVGLLGGTPPGVATAAVLCSVVPMLTDPWTEALGRLTGNPPVQVTAETASIPIRYRDRSAVGADRLAIGVAVS